MLVEPSAEAEGLGEDKLNSRQESEGEKRERGKTNKSPQSLRSRDPALVWRVCA